jgi:Zn-dependent protease
MGMAITALAGPVSNLVLSIVTLTLSTVTDFYYQYTGAEILYWLSQFLISTTALSVGLGVFNLLPIPPFDGSRVAYVFLPTKWYFGIMKYERYIMLALLVLLWTGALTTPLSMISDYILRGLYFLVELIPFFG